MLVVTRTEGQSILIGDEVKITVLETNGGQVDFGIVAPTEISVLREELTGKNAKGDSASSLLDTEQ